MALRRIALRDFVIVRALELDLSTGFTVLTGETGAGKSILIDALQLALGNRADAGSVREGAERLDVSAEFDADPTLTGWLDEGGFETGDALLLRRTVDLQGRSRGWINGSPATATQLRELGDRLLDIHGQHAWPARCLRRREHHGTRQRMAGMATSDLDTGNRPLRARLAATRARTPSMASGRGDEAGARRGRVGRPVGQPHPHLQRPGAHRRSRRRMQCPRR
jgi:DNA repair protein RecN (Recombination protein N)